MLQSFSQARKINLGKLLTAVDDCCLIEVERDKGIGCNSRFLRHATQDTQQGLQFSAIQGCRTEGAGRSVKEHQDLQTFSRLFRCGHLSHEVIHLFRLHCPHDVLKRNLLVAAARIDRNLPVAGTNPVGLIAQEPLHAVLAGTKSDPSTQIRETLGFRGNGGHAPILHEICWVSARFLGSNSEEGCQPVAVTNQLR